MAAAKPPKKPAPDAPEAAAPEAAAPEATAPEAAAPEAAAPPTDEQKVAALVGCSAENILVWRDYGDRVVVVTRDGQKLTGAVAENE